MAAFSLIRPPGDFSRWEKGTNPRLIHTLWVRCGTSFGAVGHTGSSIQFQETEMTTPDEMNKPIIAEFRANEGKVGSWLNQPNG